MPSLKKPLQQPNTFKVGKSQWKKWSDIAQRVFNETYEVMLANQSLFLHPKADPARVEYWTTTAWNAAWTAADAVMRGLDKIIEGKGYARAK